MLRDLVQVRAGRAAIAAWAALAVLTAVGLMLLWPTGESDAKLAPALETSTEEAQVVAVTATRCPAPGVRDCRRVRFVVRSGPDSGRAVDVEEGGSSSLLSLSPGDRIRVVRNSQVGAGASVPPYALADFDRRGPLTWLVAVFVAIVAVLGRRRGVMALLGLVVSLLVVVSFVVPAMLDGRSPLGVALAGSLAVMLVTIALAHGMGAKSIAAALGTAASLALTVGLALLFTHLSHLSGFTSDEATLLGQTGADVSLSGLVVAGMVIGALGVLDDVTVSQASTVMALRRADPRQRAGELYRAALGVGRDHVAATVNTLVLAYVGASLPVLMIFSVGSTPFTDAVNGEAVAEQVVATLVGSIGLIAAVPITTGLAALLASRLPAHRVGGEHAHAHAH